MESARKKKENVYSQANMANAFDPEFEQIHMDLEDIIEIDSKNKILKVEPGMKMGTLTHKLLSQGWTIPVIPELESLTIGGCINGTGIETSSIKYGLFADTCLEYEVVLTDGSIVHCSKDKHADLFANLPWSHGTLAFLTAVSIPLIEARKYVKVEYHLPNSMEKAKTLLLNPNYDFIEGIMFGLKRIVVMHGTLVETAEKDKINHINRWYKPWFYKYVETLLTKGPRVEYIPIRDYYHRHQRSYFWEQEIALPIGNHALVRYLFGWTFPWNFQLMKFVIPEFIYDAVCTYKHVIQDFLVPMSKLENLIQLSHAEVEVYPIWLCPCRFFKGQGLARLPPNLDENEMYIDVGIYGISNKTGKYDPEKKIRRLEKFALKNNGFQFLYADSYMTRGEFKKMFNTKSYDVVRKRYNCEDGFPEIYDKISRQARKY